MRVTGAQAPEAVRIPRPSWINARTGLGILLFAVAFLAGHRTLSQDEAGVMVWSAARTLAEGEVIGAGDLRAVDVTLPADQLGLYLQASVALDGATVTRTVEAGQLVVADWLAAPDEAPPGAEVAIPVAPEHAVAGDLRPGDRVLVIATYGAGRPGARTETVAEAVEVVAIGTTGGIVDDDTITSVVVSIQPADAARVVRAVRAADIDIVKLRGPAEVRP